MRLWHTKTVWEKLAREDAMWAVLTDPAKDRNRWQVDEFFATGRATVDADMAYLSTQLPTLAKRDALDFGCGVGRLSQALAPHFDRVTGLDVAAAMIEQANQHNRHGERVTYVHNPAGHLRQFADHSFDFVYSVITLQHIPASLQRGYLREFLRVCRPGGAVFFQLVTTEPDKRWRFSWYPPTMWMRIRRYFRRAATIDPTMTMNAVPRAEASNLLEQAGGRIVDIQPYGAAGELESWSYLVTKD
ncbi:class I SAM-dependent methyltransferase [Synoicihabitans lomoniglobus]|uniref:Class I SAM-dependent methyltransferase n=1 Tax=Synoicihabitans lomoniglobus TaxID=2909285 RepID=A0AAE9ZVS5_9BACT|nr:class I SAM-dependent methyltransferase [Opitutaceae bacterium LMO-M01]WED63760.1 class I SAM-dependent methyltransferase [Opitutaceae bacterium LMO-M01]